MRGVARPCWPQWMQAQVKQAKFVLAVCTPTYRRRFDGKARELAATFEGLLSRPAAPLSLAPHFWPRGRVLCVLPEHPEVDAAPPIGNGGHPLHVPDSPNLRAMVRGV